MGRQQMNFASKLLALTFSAILPLTAHAVRLTEEKFNEFAKSSAGENGDEGSLKLLEFYEAQDLSIFSSELLTEELKKKGPVAKALLEKALKLPSLEIYFDKSQLESWVKTIKPTRDGFDLLDLIDLKTQWNSQKLSSTEPYFQKLNDSSPFYEDALLMLSLFEWKNKNYVTSLGFLEILGKRKLDTSMKNQVTLLKARIQFSQGDYASAMENYRSLQSQFYLWPEAMMEAAWAQVQMKDFEKAAGSMYSLHQDYFKKVYYPESYFVRSLAYFSLCQYGDALQVVQTFEKKYSAIQKLMDKYAAEDKEVTKLRARTIEFLQTKTNSSGLPKALLLYFVADPEYVFLQHRVNTLESQTSQLMEFNREILKAAREKTEFKDANERKRLQAFRKNLEGLRTRALASNEKRLTDLKLNMDKYFKKKFLKTNLDLKQNLVETQKLRFEIYSRAGQELGSLKPEGRDVAKVKDPTTENEATWSFIGEIWEDEVGHFKSSLENRCQN